MKITFKQIAFAAVAAAGIAIAVKAIKKRSEEEQSMTVEAKQWKKTESISEWETRTEEGWEVPDKAYDVKSERRPKESKAAEVAKVVNVCGDTLDTGMRITVPAQTTYEPWYTYKIDKWVCVDAVESYGETDSTDAYKDSSGVRYDPDKKVEYGDRKVFSRIVKFTLTGICDQTGEEVTVEVSPTVYDLAKKGKTKIAYKLGLFSKKPRAAHIMNVLETVGGTNDEVDSTEE